MSFSRIHSFLLKVAGPLVIMLAYNNCAPSFQATGDISNKGFSSTEDSSIDDLKGLDPSQAFSGSMSGSNSSLVSKLSSNSAEGFACSTVTKGETQLLLNRNLGPLTKEQYENSVNGVFGISIYNTSIPTLFRSGAYNSHFGLENPSFEFVSSHFDSALYVISEIKKNNSLNQAVLGCSSNVDSCLEALINNYGRLLFKRSLTSFEKNTLVSKAKEFSSNNIEIMEAGLYLLLVSPQFTYHSVGTDLDFNDFEMQSISDLDLASRISFYLWGRVPDKKLLDIAEQGNLRNNLEEIVEEMIADDRSIYVARALAYNWFNLGKFRFQNAKGYNNLNQAEVNWSLAEQLTFFINNLIKKNEPVTSLFNSKTIFHTAKTASIYKRSTAGLGNGFSATQQADPNRSAGVLTHIGVLAQNSSNGEINVFNRGRFVLEDVLCEKPIGTPSGEVINLVDHEATTIPESVNSLSKKGACAVCHQRMDPYGKGLEMFSSMGFYREAYSSNGDKIQYSANLSGRTIASVQDLSEFISIDKAEQVNYCATKNLLSLAISKNLFSDGAIGDQNKVGSCLAIDFYGKYVSGNTDLKLQELIYKIIVDGVDFSSVTSKLGR